MADSDISAMAEQVSNDLFGPSDETSDETLDSSETNDENISEETQEDTTEDTETTETTETIETRAAPQSWKKEMHDSWGKLSPDIQDYIELREQQMKDGLDKDRTDADLGRVMRDVMTPYAAQLRAMGIDEPTAVKTLMNVHYQLTNSDADQRKQFLQQFAQSYGVDLGLPQQESNPELQKLYSEINGLKSNLSQRDQLTLQQERDRVTREVEAFASNPEHIYFDELTEDITHLIQAGYSLKDAYDKAIWANPVTRQKEMDRVNAEAEANRKTKLKEDADKAKKAKSANVTSRDTKSTPTEPLGTWEDTMREKYRELNS